MKSLNKMLALALGLAVILSCAQNDTHISAALSLVEQKPDSAIVLLNKVDQTRLSDSDMAMYALLYTMAQDKLGIDVNKDSLLHIAYAYYQDRSEDSLYAKCLYYMGKHYALNGNTTKAQNLFNRSANAAKRNHDYLTQSRCYVQTSVVLRGYDVDKAISYAQLACHVYNHIKDANKVYMVLNLAQCYASKPSERGKSISLARNILEYAKEINDSSAISDVFHHLSVFYRMCGNEGSAVRMARESFSYNPSKNIISLLSLENAFCQADSLEAAKSLLSQIKQENYADYGDILFSLRQFIALSEKNYKQVNDYADSTELYINRKYAKEFASKDSQLLLEKTSAIQREHQGVIIFISILLILSWGVILLVLRLFYVRKKTEEKMVECKKEVELKDQQIVSVRNVLLKNIQVVHKLKAESERINECEEKRIVLNTEDWDELIAYLDNTDNHFVERLKESYPSLTQKDIRFLMLIRLRLPTHRIAKIYHIEERSVRQKLYLIKPKLRLGRSDGSAKEFIENF